MVSLLNNCYLLIPYHYHVLRLITAIAAATMTGGPDGAKLSTPFSLQIKINELQIKISKVQIKLGEFQIKISKVQIKISEPQIKISKLSN